MRNLLHKLISVGNFIFLSAIAFSINCWSTNSVVATKIGDTQMFIYSSDELDLYFSEHKSDVNKNFFLNFSKPLQKYTNMRNLSFAPLTKDSQSAEYRLSKTFEDVNLLMQRQLGISFLAQSNQYHFIINQDTHGFMLENLLPLQECNELYIENTILSDWQMANETISGQIYHDDKSKDRFIFKVQPEQTQGILRLFSKKSKSNFPSSFFAPIDKNGAIAVGSWKGKSFALESSGFISEPPSCPFSTVSVNNVHLENNEEKIYENGLVFKKMKNFHDGNPIFRIKKWHTIDNLSVLEIDEESYIPFLGEISEVDLSGKKLSQILRLIKRDSGFTKLDNLPIDYDSNATVLMLNQSIYPPDYDYYNLAQDFHEEGLPVIQLYHTNPYDMIQTTTSFMRKLSLSPIDEIFSRKIGNFSFPEKRVCPRLHTEIDIFIYE